MLPRQSSHFLFLFGAELGGAEIAERRVRARRFVEVETPYGRARVKISEDGSFAPEYEDCRRLALESGAPLRRVLEEAGFAYLKTTR